MATAAIPAPLDVRAIATVIAMATVFGVQQGMTYPLLALLLDERGYSQSLIGLNAAMLPLGLIAAAPLIAPLARRIGAATTALTGAALLVLALVLLATSDHLGVWFVARFLLGLGVSVLYVLSETWLNLMVPSARRGRWLAIYVTALGAGFALGPALLLVTGTGGLAPFAVAIALTLAAAAFLLAARGRLPALAADAEVSIRAFLPLAPVLLLAVAGAASFDQAVLSFMPLYALAMGAGDTGAKLVLTVLVLGNVLLQLPIGWLADRYSRRAAMLACSLATVAGAFLLPLVSEPGPLLWLLVFLWGGVSYGTYTVALIVLGDRFEGSLLLAGNAAFALTWGVAGLVGPTATGAAMDLVGPQGLPLVLGLLFALLTAAFMTRRARLDSPAPVA